MSVLRHIDNILEPLFARIPFQHYVWRGRLQTVVHVHRNFGSLQSVFTAYDPPLQSAVFCSDKTKWWDVQCYGGVTDKCIFKLIPIEFCTMTNKCTIISQIITLLHVPTLSCHPQGNLINTFPSYTSISNASVGNTSYN
jgi:hypothetical protein